MGRSSTIAALILACSCARSPTGKVTAADRGAGNDSLTTEGKQPVPVSIHVTKASPVRAYPRWVARVAPAPFARFGATDVHPNVFAPIRNNYGTDATVYLGNWRVGLVEQGRRFVYADGRLSAVDPDRASLGIERVLPREVGLGGGFLFSGPAGLYFADTFDGPMRQLASDANLFLGVAPGSVMLGGEQSRFVSTSDALPIAGSPNADKVVAHRRGFAIAWSKESGEAWFTRSGREWRKLANLSVRDAIEDGDSLLALTDSGALSVGSDGRPKRVQLTTDERLQKRLGRAAGFIPGHWGPEDAYEGALIDAGWTHTGRSDDEWLGVHGGQLWLAHSRGREQRSLGAVPRDGDCNVAIISGQTLLTCAELGTSLSVFGVRLPDGQTTLERKIQVRRGVARQLGTTDTFPPALLASATCAGDADAGLCVRGSDGTWANYPPTPREGRLLVFPTEVIAWVSSEADAWELRVSGRPTRVFRATEVRRINDTLGIGGHDPSEMRTVLASALRTATGIRMFFTPNPMKPVAGEGDSYALDLPIDSAASPSLERVSGVVACAGNHGLRLAGGQLWETNDAWHTWHPVDPPPIGRVPRDLAAAMCSESGCVLGAWARIGWN